MIQNWEDLVIICRQDYVNGKGAKQVQKDMKPYPENQVNNLEDATPLIKG